MATAAEDQKFNPLTAINRTIGDAFSSRRFGYKKSRTTQTRRARKRQKIKKQGYV